MHHSILVSTSLLASANLEALLGRWAIWNVVSLTTSHTALTGCHLKIKKTLVKQREINAPFKYNVEVCKLVLKQA